MTRHFTLAAAVTLALAGVAQADALTDRIVSDLTEQGFDRIEVREGLTRTRVEAIRGTEKVEQVFSRTTGDLLRQELDTADRDEDMAHGVSIREFGSNFPGRNRDDSDSTRHAGRDAETGTAGMDGTRSRHGEGHELAEIEDDHGPGQDDHGRRGDVDSDGGWDRSQAHDRDRDHNRDDDRNEAYDDSDHGADYDANGYDDDRDSHDDRDSDDDSDYGNDSHDRDDDHQDSDYGDDDDHDADHDDD